MAALVSSSVTPIKSKLDRDVKTDLVPAHLHFQEPVLIRSYKAAPQISPLAHCAAVSLKPLKESPWIL